MMRNTVTTLLFLTAFMPSLTQAATTYFFESGPYGSIQTDNRSSIGDFDDSYARLAPTDSFSGSFTVATALGASADKIDLLRDTLVTDFSFTNGIAGVSFSFVTFCNPCSVGTNAQGDIVDWSFNILAADPLPWGDSASARFDTSGGQTIFSSQVGVGLFDYREVETTATWTGGIWTTGAPPTQTALSPQSAQSELDPVVTPLPAAAWMLLAALAVLTGLGRARHTS